MVTHYCSVQCQASDKINHEMFHCASYLRHQRSTRLYMNNSTNECHMPVHSTDTRGVLHAQNELCMYNYTIALDMPATNKLEFKLRVQACNAIVDATVLTAKAWRDKRQHIVSSMVHTTTTQRLMHELLKKRTIEIMFAYLVCIAFGQNDRASDFSQEVQRHCALIATENFQDDFDFNIHLMMFNKNSLATTAMMTFDKAIISFDQIRQNVSRFSYSPVEWHSFLWHKIDKQRLLWCYHVHQEALASWQAREMYALETDRSEMPAAIDMHSIFVCLVLRHAGNALLHLRRALKSNIYLNNTQYMEQLQSLWRDFKKISKCICEPNQCVGCINDECVKYTRAKSSHIANDKSTTKPPSMFLQTRASFVVELRQAGIRHSLCTYRSILTASLNGVSIAVRWYTY